jgi:serine/threonine protein kinase/Tol biopolymer transport system component
MNSLDGRKVSPRRSPSGDVPREMLTSGTVVGRYRITSLLASGGMGDVYRAHDQKLERDVALKVLPAELTNDIDRVQRFAQEARAASALNHPNIVAIYEIGHARPSRTVRAFAKERDPKRREIHYLAMELIEGETLREYVRNAVPLRRRIELLTHIAEGLGKAHAAGIVHRDLKPDNIMVASEGYAKIVDFGLAKLIEPPRGWNPLGADSPTMRALTQQGELIGTAGYMSPEQIAGKPIDQRSDIFAFGCIAYEMIAGKRPFDGDSFVDTLHQILHAEPAALQNGPAELQRIVARCLVKERDDRYQSIRDVAIELRDVLRQLDVATRSDAHRFASADVAPSSRRASSVVFVTLACVIAVAALVFGLKTQPRGAAPALAAAATPRADVAIRRLTISGRVTHATISRDGHYVAYVARDDKGAALMLQHVATGSSITLVPASPTVNYSGVAFAPDGNHVVYTRYDGSVYGAMLEVPILGGTAVKLVEDADTLPALSPDGRQLAFSRDDYNGRSTVLMIANRDGSNPRVVAKWDLPNRATSPSWSPDGRTIVVARSGEVYALSLAQNRAAKVAINGWRGTVSGVAWSNDGASLIVSGSSERAGGNVQLVRVAWPSGVATTLTNDSDSYAEPSVADTKAISAVQTKRESNIWSVALDGAARQLTRGLASTAGIGGAAWLPDGRFVYSSATAGTFDLWIDDPAAGTSQQLTRAATAESHPTLLPDNHTIVYVVRDATHGSLWRIDVDGRNARPLTSGGDDYDFVIAPGGKRIIYASLDQQNSRFVIRGVDAGGGPSSLLATAGVALKDLQVTSSEIVFSAYQDSMMRVFKVPVNGGGEMQRLTTGRSSGASLSPDGKLVACAFDTEDYVKSKLAIVPIGGGKPLKVIALNGWRYRWMPDGDSIAYTRTTGDAENIYVRSVSSGAERQVTHFTEGGIVNFQLSPDAKQLLVTHAMQASDVVTLTP